MPAAHGKQFTVYCSQGPNPWKVIIILEELGLKYEILYKDTSTLEQKEAAFTALNPNGRYPALIDHANNDFVIWESGAIMLYLVGKYDKKHKISFADFNDTAIANQYLMFQMSGQGPYFGQLGWFTLFHPEKVPSAIARYTNEAFRVLGVLEDILKDKEYLVGNKATYADIAFLPFFWVMGFLSTFKEWETKYPNVGAWVQRLGERESVKEVLAIRATFPISLPKGYQD